MKRLTKRAAGYLTGMLLAGVMPAVALATSVSAQACTSLVLPTTDGARIYGRTMEFEYDMKSALIALPRRFPLKGTGPEERAGLVWQGKYAAIGMNAFGLPLLLDGMNEKGLAGGILYFPGEAKCIAGHMGYRFDRPHR